ncbi:hypothetical protein C8R44DRAFT_877770 [Mycena epipterygia]|nr:hypothetical protein C8R44DRAFT_877770 [Mycena epipterygia]
MKFTIAFILPFVAAAMSNPAALRRESALEARCSLEVSCSGGPTEVSQCVAEGFSCVIGASTASAACNNDCTCIPSPPCE